MNRRITMAWSRAGRTPGSPGDKEEGLITLRGDWRPPVASPLSSPIAALCFSDHLPPFPREPLGSSTNPKPRRESSCFWSDLEQRLGSWLAASWVLERKTKLLGGALLGKALGLTGVSGRWRGHLSSPSPETLACPSTPRDGRTR